MRGLSKGINLLESAMKPGYSTAFAMEACTLVNQVLSSARSAALQQTVGQAHEHATMGLWSPVLTCCPQAPPRPRG